MDSGEPIWPVFLSACSRSAESGLVEVSQQQLGEAAGQRGWWETAATAALGPDEAARYVD